MGASEDHLQKVIGDFKKRSKKLRKAANYFFVVIVFSIIIGVAAFILAGKVTNIDFGKRVTLIDKIENTKKSRTEAEKKLKTLRDEKWKKITESYQKKYDSLTENFRSEVGHIIDTLKRNGDSLRIEIDIENYHLYNHLVIDNEKPLSIDRGDTSVVLAHKKIYFTLIDGEFDNENNLGFNGKRNSKKFSLLINNTLPEIVRLNNKFVATKEQLLRLNTNRNLELSAVQKSYTTTQQEIQNLTQLIKDLEKQKVAGNLSETNKNSVDIKTNSEKQEFLRFIQTNLTRFGVLAMFILLIRILLQQYRYNIRLSTFYSARADALLLLSEVLDKEELKKLDFNELMVMFTPALEFGKIPDSLVEQLVQTVKEAVLKNN